MQFILRYVKPYFSKVAGGMICKFLGSIMDLFLPWLLAYMLDEIVPLNDRGLVYLYGGLMLLCAALAWLGNIFSQLSSLNQINLKINYFRSYLEYPETFNRNNGLISPVKAPLQ